MKHTPMLVLFTDFGTADPYVGQIHGVLASAAPGVPIIDLTHQAPDYDVRSSAYLLAALAPQFPPGAVFMAVVDPGVGSDRAPMMIDADGRWYVGPDNGLFELVLRRANRSATFRIGWQPDHLSPSFHGRDLFAPVAAMLACGRRPEHTPFEPGRRTDWPDDLARVIYIDHFGNAMTGIRGATVGKERILAAAGRSLEHRKVFSAAEPNTPFWYVNSSDLVELAVAGGSVARLLQLHIGDKVELRSGIAASPGQRR